jgi:hypothetical protein
MRELKEVRGIYTLSVNRESLNGRSQNMRKLKEVRGI